ncbi:hypothetical protein C8J57DRAFT_1658198 [Mycena rebaudengoi]|nr:hypothetical protein C8J57DRAFT_1658198 [Mycena rebaudengoi]
MTNDQHRRGAGTEVLTREYISRCLTFLSQAEVAERRGLRVLAINHDTLRAADQETPRRDLFKELVKGDDVRMAVMTPKMLVGPQMTTLLRTPEFLDLVRWMSVDEVGQEGIFLSGYKSLVNLRMRLNSSMVICTTLTVAVGVMVCIRSPRPTCRTFTTQGIERCFGCFNQDEADRLVGADLCWAFCDAARCNVGERRRTSSI